MKIVLVTSRFPWPPRRGDQLRAVQALAALAGEHEVTLLAPEPGEGAESVPAGGFAVELYRVRRRSVLRGALRAVRRGLPWQTSLFYQPDLGRRLRRLAREADLVSLQLVRLVPHLRDVGETPVVVDLIDSLSLNALHRARRERWWLAPWVRAESRRLARAERAMIGRARRALVVCERDRVDLVERLELPPELARRLEVVRVAAPAPTPKPTPRPTPSLVFTGNLGYFVNADAVSWWVETVWRRLAEQRPELSLVVAGARPGRRLARRVAAAGGELIDSPADLRPILAGATVALAPLRCGSGVPIKVLEAWAAGVPVVASSYAAAGTTARPGEDLLVADDPAGWLRAIGTLLDDPAAGERIAAAGRARLAADYAPGAVAGGWRRAVVSAEAPAAR